MSPLSSKRRLALSPLVAKAVVVSVVLLWSLDGSSGVMRAAQALSPQCTPVTTTATLTTSNTLVAAGNWRMSSLWMDCLAYEFVDASTTDADRARCAGSAKGSLVFVQAVDASNKIFAQPLQSVIGGSVVSVSSHFNRFVTYSLRFSAPQLASNVSLTGCALTLRYTTYLAGNPFFVWRATVSPFLVKLEPHVAVRNKPTTFHFATPERAQGQVYPDYAGVVPTSATCNNVAGIAWPPMNYSASPLPTITPYPILSWTYTFPYTGTFIVCVNFNNEGWVDMAYVHIFGGNPTYFTISGLIPGGAIMLNTNYVITFVGHNFTLTPASAGGDSAKLVSILDDCNSGAPAGGVGQNDNLGPDDAVSDPTGTGLDVRFAFFPIRITIPGAFRICYRVALDGGAWTEVHLYDELPPASKEQIETLAPAALVPATAPATTTSTTGAPTTSATTTATTATTPTTITTTTPDTSAAPTTTAQESTTTTTSSAIPATTTAMGPNGTSPVPPSSSPATPNDTTTTTAAAATSTTTGAITNITNSITTSTATSSAAPTSTENVPNTTTTTTPTTSTASPAGTTTTGNNNTNTNTVPTPPLTTTGGAAPTTSTTTATTTATIPMTTRTATTSTTTITTRPTTVATATTTTRVTSTNPTTVTTTTARPTTPAPSPSPSSSPTCASYSPLCPTIATSNPVLIITIASVDLDASRLNPLLAAAVCIPESAAFIYEARVEKLDASNPNDNRKVTQLVFGVECAAANGSSTSTTTTTTTTTSAPAPSASSTTAASINRTCDKIAALSQLVCMGQTGAISKYLQNVPVSDVSVVSGDGIVTGGGDNNHPASSINNDGIAKQSALLDPTTSRGAAVIAGVVVGALVMIGAMAFSIFMVVRRRAVREQRRQRIVGGRAGRGGAGGDDIINGDNDNNSGDDVMGAVVGGAGGTAAAGGGRGTRQDFPLDAGAAFASERDLPQREGPSTANNAGSGAGNKYLASDASPGAASAASGASPSNPLLRTKNNNTKKENKKKRAAGEESTDSDDHYDQYAGPRTAREVDLSDVDANLPDDIGDELRNQQHQRAGADGVVMAGDFDAVPVPPVPPLPATSANNRRRGAPGSGSGPGPREYDPPSSSHSDNDDDVTFSTASSGDDGATNPLDMLHPLGAAVEFDDFKRATM